MHEGEEIGQLNGLYFD